jgi:hypothetical protein
MEISGVVGGLGSKVVRLGIIMTSFGVPFENAEHQGLSE